jgi:hypothetical protein
MENKKVLNQQTCQSDGQGTNFTQLDCSLVKIQEETRLLAEVARSPCRQTGCMHDGCYHSCSCLSKLVAPPREGCTRFTKFRRWGAGELYAIPEPMRWLGACVELVAHLPNVLAIACGVVITGCLRMLLVDGCAEGCGGWCIVVDEGNHETCCPDGWLASPVVLLGTPKTKGEHINRSIPNWSVKQSTEEKQGTSRVGWETWYCHMMHAWKISEKKIWFTILFFWDLFMIKNIPTKTSCNSSKESLIH